MSNPIKYTDKEIKEARHQLWRMGNLEWKLDPTQKEIYKFVNNTKGKISVINCSRRIGKSYLLTIIAIQNCLQKPKSIIKFLQPEQKMIRMNIKPLIDKIFIDCPPELRPTFKTQDNIYVFPNGSEIQLAGTDGGQHEKLRGGDCLAEHTLILTPFGPKPIKDIQIGDMVYGYNEDGSISETAVTAKHDNGIKEVTDIYMKNQYIGACTDNHRWATNTLSSLMRHNPKFYEKEFKNISEKNSRIVQRLPKIRCGFKNVNDAYLIGAFIGDGMCSSKTGIQLNIASGSDIIPSHCASLLNCFFQKSGKNKYSLKTTLVPKQHSDCLDFSFYQEWLKGKNYLQKNFDYDEVNTWNRKSCLKLIAGLIDTDGNVYYNKKDNALEITYASCNLPLIYNIQKLFFKLFHFQGSIKTRTPKKGEIQYTFKIRNSYYVKWILKEISPYLALDYKKYQKWMDNHHSRSTGQYSGQITKGNRYLCQTYDLTVDNKTHLYLVSHGLVTHNSSMCIIDEAAFVNGDLQYIVRSVLLPTTMLTRGKIILSSTSPREAAHDFAKYMEQAEQNGTLIKKTIYDALKDNEGLDNPRFTKEIIDEIIAEYPGGITNDEFRRECLCELLSDADNSVIPEFTASVQNDIIVEWPRPGFCTKYISMDIGFRDLTVALFAYYDFDHGVTVIEDEIVISGPKMTTEALAITLLKKEEELWSNKYTGEKEDPYLRIADNNLIVINDLQRLHGLTFLPTKKDNRDAQINAVRMEIGARQIYINPRCKTLIQHLKHATWNKNRDDFSRSTDNGHYDACMALVYLIRNIDKNKNPYPPGYKYRALEQSGNGVFVRSTYKEEKKYEKFNSLFAPKSSLKR